MNRSAQDGSSRVGQGRESGSRRLHRTLWLTAMLALVAAVDGCVRRSPGEQGGELTAPAFVQVDNRAFLDATVYVLRSGQRIRLGQATGSSTSTFTLPRGLVMGATQLSFLIDFVGSQRSPISEEITVLPGDTVMLMIPPQ